MNPTADNRQDATLDDFIEAYEAAQARHGQADLTDFLPAPSDPLYLPVLRELVRVDLEYSWQRGQPTLLEEYQRRFPELFRDPISVQEIIFEDERQRRQAGADPMDSECMRQLGAPVGSAGGGPDLSPNSAANQTLADDLAGLFAADAIALAEAARSFRDLRRSGSTASLDSWLQTLSQNSVYARLFRDLYRADPDAADRLSQALTELPLPGSEFLGFRLLAELGRGAFGKVYLARQGDLANRLVVLKVSTALFDESQNLAQLQHTHIVPIYSLHHREPFQAVCMPYLGTTTLADILKLQRGLPAPPVSGRAFLEALETRRDLLKVPAAATSAARAQRLATKSYIDAVLEIAADLAEGLGHAHERGILHRDLKPANVLLSDDGQALLLDFNLSEDTKLRRTATAALIGGTLAYMAPEHLEAFDQGAHPVDARSDLYAVGLIVYELLTGRLPFATTRGPLPGVLQQMIEERRQPPPPLHTRNPAVSPAVAAIVRRCLEPDPDRRYQEMAHLAEDLRRHLANLPLRHTREPSLVERLRKWWRRHPRAAPWTVAGLTAVLLLVVATGGVLLYQRLAGLQAAESFRQFDTDMKIAQFHLLTNAAGNPVGAAQQGDACANRALARYGVLEDAAWQERAAVQRLGSVQRKQLREQVGELLLLWARVTLQQPDGPARSALRLNELAERCYPPAQAPRALWLQRAAALRRLGEADAAAQTEARAQHPTATTARGLGLLAGEHAFHGRWREARVLLEQATRLDPQDYWLWFDLAMCHERLGHDAGAAACYNTCTALWPDFAPLYFQRGTVHLRRQEYPLAHADFNQALHLRPNWPEAHLNRSLTSLALGEYGEAQRDLTWVLDRDPNSVRALFLRARVREKRGESEGARQDRAEALRRTPSDEAGWLARGEARTAADPGAALDDFNQALQCNPRSRAALRDRAHVLADKLGRTDAAIHTLDQLLALYPDCATALAGRAVLWARLAKRELAVRDAEACLLSDPRPAMLYRAGCAYALTSRAQPDDRIRALHLLSAALKEGYGADLIATDADLAPLRDLPQFRRLISAVAKAEKDKD
jgi:serine/threonine protein kinase/Tfp pilus assembly protein PilF